MMHYTTELLGDNTLLFRFTVPAELHDKVIGHYLNIKHYQ